MEEAHPSVPFLGLGSLGTSRVSAPWVGSPSGLALAGKRRAGASLGQTSESPRMKLPVVLVRRNPQAAEKAKNL